MGSELMPEKLRLRYQEGAADLLEPDETVELAVQTLPLPAVPYLVLALTVISPIALLPYAIQKNCSALLTDRNVYVMKNTFSLKAQRVMFKAARGQFDGEAGGSGGWGHYLRVGDHKIWLALPSKIRLRAAAIAAAGSARPEALPAA